MAEQHPARAQDPLDVVVAGNSAVALVSCVGRDEDGAFLAEVLRRGFRLHDRDALVAQARLATAAGALAVMGEGGCGKLASYEQAAELARRLS
ncbi:MAG: hypothetical protein AB1486_22935 [Planctomycetota bacterium]